MSFEQAKQWIVNELAIDSKMNLVLLREEKDNLGHSHYRFQQTYFGKPIEGAVWIIHAKNNKVYAMNGLIYKNLTAEKHTVFSEEDALESAKNKIGATQYKWEIEGEEKHLRWEKNDPSATYFPEGELVYVSLDGSFDINTYRLAYKFDIYAQEPLSRSEVYVDAISGIVLSQNELIHVVDEPGTAHTAYSGEQGIVANNIGGVFLLRDSTRGGGVNTFNMEESTFYEDAVDFEDDDNDWNNVNPELDEYATDAHWGTEVSYDYFFLEHGRNSIDNEGFPLNSYVHYNSNFTNAFWDGERMTYGDGGVGFSPLVSIDISGHEVVHGLTEFTAGLIYMDESGALNESFSDIFGTAVERYGRPDNWNWMIGEDIGSAFRSMSDPNELNSPDTYMGNFWAPLGGGDNGGVHTNSGVQNFWYYLLSEGGEGTNDNDSIYNIEALGMEKASAIAFRNLTVYLTPSSQYADARFFGIQSAIDLYGNCSFEVEQTTNAWYAVGVGNSYVEEVIAEFEVPQMESCRTPFTVDFINLSTNGTSYNWDFGDGTTSTEAAPSHTYLTEGFFDVELSVDGGDCGSDNIIVTNAIAIDADLRCEYVLAEVPDSTQILTSCKGILFDTGGKDQTYSGFENIEAIIMPEGGSLIQIEFTEFDLAHPGADCNRDYIEVYDGEGTDAPLIGRYCPSNPPPPVINSVSSIVTVVFISNGFIHGDFEMNWTCIREDQLGVDENEAAQLKIYPNPTDGIITLETDNVAASKIKITDFLGKTIGLVPITGVNTIVDLKDYNLAKGIYQFQIMDENGQALYTEKVIMQ